MSARTSAIIQLGWIRSPSLIAGTLFVIPTAGEVPIVQAMLAGDAGAGPAGALLMTLPPISVPSVAMLAGSFRPVVLAVVAASVVAFGVVGGAMAIWLGFCAAPGYPMSNNGFGA